jgi:large conductance mechanosensitive channel
MFDDFKEFILRGNVADLAIGFTVGAAFTTVAKSLVDDIIMPPVGLVVGQVEFKDLFVVLENGEPGGPYQTLSAAQDAGAVTINYGLFINNVLALLLVGLAMYFLIRFVTRLDRTMDRFDDDPPADDEPSHKKCPYCQAQIAYRAVRCPECTSRLEGFEELAASAAGPTGSED